MKINSDKEWENLTEKEREALEGLKGDKDLFIKQADKGGALVVMNRTDYEEAILKCLWIRVFTGR